jgi:hypothetical protein
LRFGVDGLGSGVEGSGFRVQGLEFGDHVTGVVGCEREGGRGGVRRW